RPPPSPPPGLRWVTGATNSERPTVPSSRIRRLAACRPGSCLPWSTILLPTCPGSRVDLLVPAPPRQAGGAGGYLVRRVEGPPHRAGSARICWEATAEARRQPRRRWQVLL